MRHLVVLAAALLLSGAVVAVTIGLGRAAAQDRERVTAVFRPGTTPESMLRVVSRAEGRLVRDTLLPFAVDVAGDRPGVAARLEAEGALVVLAALPAHALAVGGCSFLSPADYAGAAPGRPNGPAGEVWAGPL